MLPADIIACDVASTTFHACIIGDCDLILLPLVHVSRAHSNAYEVEGALHTHLRIFDPEMRLFIDLEAVPIELIFNA
jgi:hypothetical protein